jgi:hypothetical protein
MSENAYLITWQDDEGNQDGCVVSAFTIAEADEKFGRAYGNLVVSVMLLGDFCRCEGEA